MANDGTIRDDTDANALIRRLEQSELEVWLRLWRAVPVPLALEAGMHHERIGSGTALILEKLPVWLFNRVMRLGDTVDATEGDIDRLWGLYHDKGLDFAIALSPAARPSELGRWMELRGFRVVNEWAKMHRGAEPPPRIDSEFRIDRVGPEQTDSIGEVVGEGFGVPGLGRRIFAATVNGPDNHVYLAYEDTKPVAVAVLSLTAGRIGHLHTATTLPSYRGHGLHGALMARRIRDGIRLGCTSFATETGLLADAVNHSYNNMLRFGFRMAYRRPNYLYRNDSA